MSHANQGRTHDWVVTADTTMSRRRVLQGTLAAATLALPLPRPASAQETAGEPIAVFPSPGCQVVSPRTEISFRGDLPDDLGPIEVTASRTRTHAGILRPHADGMGVSFLPDFPFEPGEAVTVRTQLAILGAPNGVVRYLVAEAPYLDANPSKNEPAEPDRTRTFRSRPDLVPPRIEILVAAEGVAPGHAFIAPKRGTGQNGTLIIDNTGEPIWYYTPDLVDEQMFDFRVQTYQERPVLTWWQGVGGGRHAWGHWVILDETYEEIALLQAGNGYDGADIHELTLTPRGTALVNIYNSVRWDTSAAGGAEDGAAVDSIVQELEIATGRVIFEWHSLDHIALDESYTVPTNEDGELGFDYFHVNSANETGDGNLIVNARNTWACYTIDRRSGEVIWRIGGKQSDFAMGDDAQPAYQHDARLWPNGELSLFDNADDAVEGAESRGLVLQLDMEEMTATVAREYRRSEPTLSTSQGNLQVLPSGNVFIGWGDQPWLTEFAEDGSVLFDAQIMGGKHSYRAFRFPWTGRPTAPPDIAAERGESGGVTIYASWNGATEVAAWQALAGLDGANLAPAGDPAPRTGFETELTVETDAAFIAVAALDEGGTELGRSAVIEV